MRTTFRHIIAATAAILTLFSCAKDLPVVETPAPGTGEDGERVITASFSPATKTQPDTDGLTPMFTDGDLIKVSNGTAAPQVCTVRVNGKGSGRVAFFRTTLTGPLKAVYPADAAVLSGNTITGVSVLSNPSGKFRDANIAMAENVTTEARFHNKATILRFYVDALIGVKSIKITSTENIATGSKTITVDAGTSTLDQITDDPEKRLCYVPVLKGVNTHHMTFESETTGQGQGTVTKTMTSDNTLEEGKMYNIFIPYYIDLGTVGKWGYCNVGAFLPEERGWFFSWGNTKGYIEFSDNESDYNSRRDGDGVDIKNAKTNIPVDPKYDAACKHWGEGWRMFTYAEYNALANGTTSTWGPINGKDGRKYIDKGNADKYVFLPVTFPNDGSAYYWSSTWANDVAAWNLYFFSSNANKLNSSRFWRGRTIRPIYDEFSVEGELSDYGHKEFEGVPQDAPLSGVFTVNKGPDGVAGTADDVKVKFSKGNLRYTIATSQWSFFEHQYDCGPANYADGHDKEISLFTWGKSFWSYVPDGAGYYEGFEDISGTTRDWGTGKWRTLTYDEWIYLLDSRSKTGINRGYVKAKLWNGIQGVIIFPDDYPTQVENESGISIYIGAEFPTTVVSEARWAELESAGVVFLPAAGERERNSIQNYSGGRDSHVEYWSSTPDPYNVSNSYSIRIGDLPSAGYNDYPGQTYYSPSWVRKSGLSVRLVTDAAP